MDPTTTRQLGRTGVALTQLGFGGAPLGDLFIRVSEADAEATLAAAWDAGIRYFDTAPWYGRGQSEHRIGRFLYRQPRRSRAFDQGRPGAARAASIASGSTPASGRAACISSTGSTIPMTESCAPSRTACSGSA